MQASLDKLQTPPHKAKNILVRHSCSKKVESNSNYQHQETFYILKYAPKYYKSLALQATCQSPLLSKVKKIKKLKGFTGYFDRHLPRQLWFNLLANNRKEIEEAPQISSNNRNISPNESFWKKLNQQKLKFFWNLTKIWLPKWKDAILINDPDNFLSSKESFMRHVWDLRNLKSLKIMVKDQNYDNVKRVMDKLNGMDRLFRRLETLSLDIETYRPNIQELFKNKKLFSHLTGLNISMKFDPILAEIPQMCKKLTSLALNFQIGVGEKPEFRTLLTSMQQLTQLKSLEFNWPNDGKDFWDYFKPQSSLEYLRLELGDYGLINAELFEEGKLKDIVAHWEETKELKTLEFGLSCSIPEKFNLLKILTTEVLKKIQKLETLKILIWILLSDDDCQKTYGPFFVEDVSHLYGSLASFEYQLYCSCREDLYTKFDLETLRPFRNLKSLKLGRDLEPCGDIEEIVSLLEGNQKEGKYPVLEFNLKRSIDSPVDWFREALESIEKAKRSDKNLKIIIGLKLGLIGYMETLEGLCNAIHSVKTIKGLRSHLNFIDDCHYLELPDKKIWELLSRYPGIRNLNVVFATVHRGLEFIRIDGEREQFFTSI